VMDFHRVKPGEVSCAPDPRIHFASQTPLKSHLEVSIAATQERLTIISVNDPCPTEN
jgi:hypothetical protein